MIDTYEDEIARMMRAADPARTPADGPLLQRHLAIRDRIIATGARSPRPQRSWERIALVSAVPFAAVFMLALVVLTVLPMGVPAVALTPAPLAYRPIADSVQEVITKAEDRLNTTAAGPQQAERRGHTVGWYMDMAIGQSSVTTTIVPEDRLTVWHEDLSGSITVRAGRPFAAGNDPTAPVAEDAPEPGALLWELTFAPGDFEAASVDAPGATDDEMLKFLSLFGIPLEPLEAGRVMTATERAFDQWRLTDAHHAAILRILAKAGGLEVLGATVDRVGREVIGLEAAFSPNPRFTVSVLISATTGRIVGMETITREALSADLPAGSVTSYALWETGNQ